MITLAFAGAEKLSVFSGTIQFRIPLIADADFHHGIGAPAKIELYYQACNDSPMPPAHFDRALTIDLSAASNTADHAGSGVEREHRRLGGRRTRFLRERNCGRLSRRTVR